MARVSSRRAFNPAWSLRKPAPAFCSSAVGAGDNVERVEMMYSPMLHEALPPIQAAGALQLDMTSVLAFVVFIVAMLFMKFALIDPYAEIVEERDRRTSGAREGVDDLVEEAQETLLTYENKMAQARQDAMSLRTTLREKGEAAREETLKDARERAESALSARREKIASALKEADGKVEVEAKSLSRSIVSRVLNTGA